jgi:hypothetical protein
VHAAPAASTPRTTAVRPLVPYSLGTAGGESADARKREEERRASGRRRD